MAGVDDKDLRIRTGKELVRRIKQNGGTAREVADFLRISPTTISHWQSGDPERIKRVGAPTNEQLLRLVGYLNHIVKRNLDSLQDLILGDFIRHREQMMLLKSLGPFLAEQAKAWKGIAKTKREQVNTFIAWLKAGDAEGGRRKAAEYWNELLRYCSHMTLLPAPEQLDKDYPWDYDDLKRLMLGFQDGVAAVEGVVEELMDKRQEE